jgi:hypothetical protein
MKIENTITAGVIGIGVGVICICLFGPWGKTTAALVESRSAAEQAERQSQYQALMIATETGYVNGQLYEVRMMAGKPPGNSTFEAVSNLISSSYRKSFLGQ